MSAVDILDRMLPKTPAQRAVIDALKAAGWVVNAVPFPGAVVFGHPHNDARIPSPDWAREDKRAWGGETYYVLHQLTVLYTITGPGEGANGPYPVTIKLLKRESAAPWVGASEGNIGLAAAVAWINEPHPGTPYAVEPEPEKIPTERTLP